MNLRVGVWYAVYDGSKLWSSLDDSRKRVVPEPEPTCVFRAHISIFIEPCIWYGLVKYFLTCDKFMFLRGIQFSALRTRTPLAMSWGYSVILHPATLLPSNGCDSSWQAHYKNNIAGSRIRKYKSHIEVFIYYYMKYKQGHIPSLFISFIIHFTEDIVTCSNLFHLKVNKQNKHH